MHVAHGEVLCGAALAAELANRTQEDLTWWAIMGAILLVTALVMLLRR